jgi:UPF0271 protein
MILSTNKKKNLYILDSTAFIKLEFPALLDSKIFPRSFFFTTSNVISELKDLKSRMNLDIARQSSRLQITDPSPEILKRVVNFTSKRDPRTPLSNTDMSILALALQLKGTLISDDFTVQNAATHLQVPIKTLSGKKITQLKEWKLKCKSCGKFTSFSLQTCPSCGGPLIRKQIRSRVIQEKKRS